MQVEDFYSPILSKKIGKLLFIMAIIFFLIIAIRLIVLLNMETANEFRRGEFTWGDLTRFRIDLMLVYAIIPIFFFKYFSLKDGQYQNKFRTQNMFSLVLALHVIYIAVRIYAPSQFYVAYIIPLEYLTILGMVCSRYKINSMLLILLLALVAGYLDGSKGITLKLLLLYFLIRVYFPASGVSLKSILIVMPLALIFTIFGLIFMVMLRDGIEINVLEFDYQQVLLRVVDIVSQRFIIIDGMWAANIYNVDYNQDYISYFNNNFIFLPMISPMGDLISQYVACNIDDSCDMSHAGAIGLPAVGEVVGIIKVATSFIIIILLIKFASYFLRNRSIQEKISFNIVLFMLTVNIFLSGNMDTITSEFLIKIFGIIVVTFLFRLTVNKNRSYE
jgi:hypothetical protein